MTEKLILSGDVGGTNTRFQLYQIHASDPLLKKDVPMGSNAPGLLVHKETFRNADFSTFKEILEKFLANSGIEGRPEAACLACAGPIFNNTVTLTNRDWVISGDALAKSVGIQRIQLINDFVGMGYGLLTLDLSTECITLNEGSKVEGGPMGCVGAGTGLGQCYLTAQKRRIPVGAYTSTTSVSSATSADNDAGQYEYYCYPTEGGHTDFAPRNDFEADLLEHLRNKFAHEGSSNRISNERVVAGSGIPNVYEYLAQKNPKKVKRAVHEAIMASGDLKAGMIAKHSKGNGACELCKKTMDTFLTHYGSEAGNCCLKWNPTGGLFITGGLTPKNLDRMKDPQDLFLPALFEKGRVSPIVKACPVYAVLADNLGERGAHLVAFKSLQDLHAAEGTPVARGKSLRVPLIWSGVVLTLSALGLSVVLAGRGR